VLAEAISSGFSPTTDGRSRSQCVSGSVKPESMLGSEVPNPISQAACFWDLPRASGTSRSGSRYRVSRRKIANVNTVGRNGPRHHGNRGNEGILGILESATCRSIWTAKGSTPSSATMLNCFIFIDLRRRNREPSGPYLAYSTESGAESSSIQAKHDEGSQPILELGEQCPGVTTTIRSFGSGRGSLRFRESGGRFEACPSPSRGPENTRGVRGPDGASKRRDRDRPTCSTVLSG